MPLPIGDQTAHQLLFVDGQDLNVRIRKSEYVNIGSDRKHENKRQNLN